MNCYSCVLVVKLLSFLVYFIYYFAVVYVLPVNKGDYFYLLCPTVYVAIVGGPASSINCIIASFSVDTMQL